MRRTYGVPFSRAGLAGLMAALVLLCLPGTSIAGGASDTSSAPSRVGPAPVRSRLRQGRRSEAGARGSAHAAEAGLSAWPCGRVVRAADRVRGHPLPIRRDGRGRRDRRSTYAARADARNEGAAPAGSRLRTARRIAAGACAPGQVATARAPARPGGRPLRAADQGGGRTPPAVARDSRQRRCHREDAEADRRRARAAAAGARVQRGARRAHAETPATDGGAPATTPARPASVESQRVGRRDRAGRRPDRAGSPAARPGRRRAAGTAQQGGQRDRGAAGAGGRGRGHLEDECGRPLPRNRARARARTTRIPSYPGGSLPGERSGHQGPVLGLPGRGVEHRPAGTSSAVHTGRRTGCSRSAT